jgi:hypothetical protein
MQSLSLTLRTFDGENYTTVDLDASYTHTNGGLLTISGRLENDPERTELERIDKLSYRDAQVRLSFEAGHYLQMAIAGTLVDHINSLKLSPKASDEIAGLDERASDDPSTDDSSDDSGMCH